MDKDEIERIVNALRDHDKKEQEHLEKLPNCTDRKKQMEIKMWLLRSPWERVALLEDFDRQAP